MTGEPRLELGLTDPESVVLPIAPFPNDISILASLTHSRKSFSRAQNKIAPGTASRNFTRQGDPILSHICNIC